MMISNVAGDFSKVTGDVLYDGKDLSKAQINADIDANSLTTRQSDRDNHLKGADFLDTQKFPSITFRSKKVEPSSDGSFKVMGDLTMHGVTRPVVLSADPLTPAIKDMHGKTRLGAVARTKVNRKDFGVNFSKTLDNGSAVVGDDVTIELDVELVQQLASPNT
jgi:polyisoprenoid-binding protein YceI